MFGNIEHGHQPEGFAVPPFENFQPDWPHNTVQSQTYPAGGPVPVQQTFTERQPTGISFPNSQFPLRTPFFQQGSTTNTLSNLHNGMFNNNNNNHSVSDSPRMPPANSFYKPGLTNSPQPSLLPQTGEYTNNLIYSPSTGTPGFSQFTYSGRDYLLPVIGVSQNEGSDRQTRSFPCPKCAKAFKRGDHLKRHLLSVHDRDHPYQCGECSKGFASVDSLIKHNLSTHSETTTSGHLCARCGKRFNLLHDLETHARSLHEEQDLEYMKGINKSSKTFSCMICHKTVSSEKNLRRHIKKLHGESGENKQLCYHCNITFDSISELHAHNTKAHTREPNFNVGCDYSSMESKSKAVPVPHTSSNHVPTLTTEIMHAAVKPNSLNYQVESKPQIAQPVQIAQKVSEVSSSTLPPNNCPQSVTMFGYQQYIHSNNQTLSLHQATPSSTFTQDQAQSENIVASVQSPFTHKHEQLFKSSIQPTNHAITVTSSENENQLPPELCMKPSLDHSASQKNICENINIKNAPNLKSDSLTIFGRSYCKEANTVSEAFAMAMKTLSDFSYDDLSFQVDAVDCMCVTPSVFQSNSPMANFHYPNSVKHDDSYISTSLNSVSNNQHMNTTQPVLVVGPAVPFSNVVSCPSQTPSLHPQQNFQQPQVPDTLNPLQVKPCSTNSNSLSLPLLAKRGRPKKKKGGDQYDSEDFGGQKMILKEFDDGVTLKFNCTVCNQTYDGIDNLMYHIESIHLSVNPHECCICKKRFAQAGNVKRHIRFVHLRERPFRCRACDSTFDRLCYLQRHMRSHIDSKLNNRDTSHLNPCNCPECGKRCLTAHHLRGHMQRKHFAKNKKQSMDLEEKYGYLFDDIEGFEIMSGVKELDEFGRPIKPSAKVKHRKIKHSLNMKQLASPPANNQREIPMNSFMANDVSDSESSSFHLKSLLQSDHISIAKNKMDSSMFNAGKTQHDLTNGTNHYAPVALERKVVKLSRKKLFRIYKNSRKFHMEKQRRILPYKCQYCVNSRFPNLSLLKSHVAIEHHSTTHRHICLLCGRSYSAKNLLMTHVSKRHRSKCLSHRLRRNKSVFSPSLTNGMFAMKSRNMLQENSVTECNNNQKIDNDEQPAPYENLPVANNYAINETYQEQSHVPVSQILTHPLVQT